MNGWSLILLLSAFISLALASKYNVSPEIKKIALENILRFRKRLVYELKKMENDPKAALLDSYYYYVSKLAQFGLKKPKPTLKAWFTMVYYVSDLELRQIVSDKRDSTTNFLYALEQILYLVQNDLFPPEQLTFLMVEHYIYLQKLDQVTKTIDLIESDLQKILAMIPRKVMEAKSELRTELIKAVFLQSNQKSELMDILTALDAKDFVKASLLLQSCLNRFSEIREAIKSQSISIDDLEAVLKLADGYKVALDQNIFYPVYDQFYAKYFEDFVVGRDGARRYLLILAGLRNDLKFMLSAVEAAAAEEVMNSPNFRLHRCITHCECDPLEWLSLHFNFDAKEPVIFAPVFKSILVKRLNNYLRYFQSNGATIEASLSDSNSLCHMLMFVAIKMWNTLHPLNPCRIERFA